MQLALTLGDAATRKNMHFSVDFGEQVSPLGIRL